MKMKNIKLFMIVFVLSTVIIAAGFYVYKQFYASKGIFPLEIEMQMIEILKDDESFLEAPDKNQQTLPLIKEEGFLPEGFLE